MKISRRVATGVFVVLGLIVSIAVFHRQILWGLGETLVNSEAPRKADMVVVLAGDTYGRRMLKGAELVREGYAPKVMISNGKSFFGLDESDAAADFAVRQGYSRETMICLHALPNSTRDEAILIPPLLRQMGVRSILLVTSPSHTARATRLFRRYAPGLEIHPVAAGDPLWCRGYWWTDRECEKTYFLEEVKTIAGFFGV